MLSLFYGKNQASDNYFVKYFISKYLFSFLNEIINVPMKTKNLQKLPVKHH